MCSSHSTVVGLSNSFVGLFHMVPGFPHLDRPVVADCDKDLRVCFIWCLDFHTLIDLSSLTVTRT